MESYSESGISPVLNLRTSQISEAGQPKPLGGSPILDVLSECRPALSWLEHQDSTELPPDEFTKQIKCLEKLGFISRHNNKAFSIRHQRLRRVLEHEAKHLTAGFSLDDLLAAENYRSALALSIATPVN